MPFIAFAQKIFIVYQNIKLEKKERKVKKSHSSKKNILSVSVTWSVTLRGQKFHVNEMFQDLKHCEISFIFLESQTIALFIHNAFYFSIN